MSIPIIVNEAFDRGVMLWLSAACNEFHGIKGSGSFIVKTYADDTEYTVSVNGTSFTYVTQAGDTEETVLLELLSQIEDTNLVNRYNVSITGGKLLIVATREIYGLYCLTTENMKYTTEAGIVVIWVNQNAYGEANDFKPPYPFVTVEVTAGTDFGTKRLTPGEDTFDTYEDITNTVRLNFYSKDRFNQFAERVSKSFNRHVYIREYLRPNGISSFGILAKNDTSALLNSKTDLRITVDISLNCIYQQATDDDDVIGVIETISVNDDKILVNKDEGVIAP